MSLVPVALQRTAGKALEGLGNFGTVPDFSLIERSGISFKLSDLQGKIWIVNFIYTSCPDTCPLQSAEMARLQGELEHKADFRAPFNHHRSGA